MCGIFGSVNFAATDKAKQIFDGLYHRGPDDQNFLKFGNVELYHTRLSIQDLTLGGKQPMVHNNLVIVFNGEIYNHMELREKYNLHSHSTSDTQTILMLFELIGMKMLDEFDGMFAFALYDQNHGYLYLARDRAGKKPLFLYNHLNKLVFSSELNVLREIVNPSINHTSVSDYLYVGHNFGRTTPYVNVTEVENGFFLKIETATSAIKEYKWFDIAECYLTKSVLSYDETLDQLDRKLQDAVKRRLDSSDLDVGSFLSGGIDSGLVTAMAAAHKPNLRTFTVKIEGAYDESPLARLVADKYSTNHTEVEISFSNLQNDITSILSNYGEPFCDSSAIPSYYVSQAAKKHLTVVLNGDGSDELFGGYRRYVPFRYFDFFNAGPLVGSSARALLKLLPIPNKKRSQYAFFHRLMELGSFNDPIKLYSYATGNTFTGFEKYFSREPELEQMSQTLTSIKNMPISSLNKLLLADFKSLLLGGLLPKMDIATMANSLEGRSPFLGKEILEFAPSLKDEYKINGVTTKSILRELSRKYLPPTLINQPKRGFEIPLKDWVNGNLKEIISDYLISSNNIYSEFLDRKFVLELLDNKVKVSQEKRAKMLFCIFGLEVWYQNLTNLQPRVTEYVKMS
jgi:asparagine synthase (glutamine-hydrolysing)